MPMRPLPGVGSSRASDNRHYAKPEVSDNDGPGLDVAGKLAGSDASKRTVS